MPTKADVIRWRLRGTSMQTKGDLLEAVESMADMLARAAGLLHDMHEREKDILGEYGVASDSVAEWLREWRGDSPPTNENHPCHEQESPTP